MDIKKKIFNLNRLLWLKRQRRRLKNNTPSILCNNCIAGVIYHDLGLRFNSPTINLFMRPDGYIRYLSDIDYYLKCELVEGAEENVAYPVGVLQPFDDTHEEVKIFFQHYKTFENAREKWVERSSRIDFDNLYIIFEFFDNLYGEEHLTQFIGLPFKHKIALTHKPYPGMENTLSLSCYEKKLPISSCLDYRGISGKRHLDEFDYVSFLNTK